LKFCHSEQWIAVLDDDLNPWVGLVYAVIDMALPDLSVILVDLALEQIEDKAFV
jgi:hypothetical protein